MNLVLLFKDILKFNKKGLSYRLNKVVFLYYRNVYSYFVKNYGYRKDIKNIPIIINNRNRLTYLLRLISWLEKNGFNNIYIIDNNSTYEPLLKFYDCKKYKIFQLKENVGHLALWKTDIFNLFKRNYYIYTDPDVVPSEECPSDAIEFFMKKLNQYPQIEKIWFGLKIDDLPDSYQNKQKVIEWEKKFWEKEIEPGIYDADIDTTFALYRPFYNGHLRPLKAYRTGGKYVARHLPWYENLSQPTDENDFYKKNVKPGSSHWISPNVN